MDSLIAEEQTLNNNLKDQYTQLSKLNEDLEKVAGSIQASYLDFSKVGTDIIFNPEFIFDVKNGQPVFFKHPQESCLFIYEEPNDVIDLIKLLSVQLRIKFNPFNLNISVIDLQFMGSPFLSMQPSSDKKDDSLRKLFQIINSKEDLSKYFEDSQEELNRKMMSIRRQFSNISDYNKFMKENDSLTEGYEFIFYQDPDLNSVQDDILVKILNNGASLGIFMHLFIQKDVFYEGGLSSRDLTNTIGRAFVLKDGEYHERAKDFVLENLIKPES